jgi:uncharacterized membrane protein
MTSTMWISVICYLALSYICIRLMLVSEEFRGEAFAFLTVGIHGLLYSAAHLIIQVSNVFWNNWSSSLRLHATFVAAAVFYILWRRVEREKDG